MKRFGLLAEGRFLASRRGRAQPDARELSDDERAQMAALVVSWWDGVLTALRARELERRGREP